MVWSNGLPVMLAAPSIWRRYQSPRVSPSMDAFSKVCTPLGKCPHMITEWVHTLRTRLAVAFAVSVLIAEGPDSKGWMT